MESENLSDSLMRIQRSLRPYIKKRQDIAHLRRVLANHLDSHVNQQKSLSRPLSLIENTSSIGLAPHGVRGIQKEYLRCARANIKARNEYALLRKEHQCEYEEVRAESQAPSHVNPDTSMQSFLELVTARHMRERLHIIQDYVDVLSQSPAATSNHLEPKVVLKEIESPPKVPPEVLNATGNWRASGGNELHGVVDRLEKSVFRAKMLLKREQKFLAKFQAENNMSSVHLGDRLEALAATRIELINWIETELASACEMSSESAETLDPASQERREKGYIASQLASIQKQYFRYTKSRQPLVMAINGDLATPNSIGTNEGADVLSATGSKSCSSNALTIPIHPYLQQIVSVTNEQRAIIQQKSHLTITLAKQLKEAGQGLDRLADESHLLPVHPMPSISSQRKRLGAPISFGDEISSPETPDSSRRAQAWVFAAESAGIATSGAISERLEEGGVAILEAQETLLELLGLLGNDIEAVDEGDSLLKDSMVGRSGGAWVTLNGKFGVIEKCHVDGPEHK